MEHDAGATLVGTTGVAATGERRPRIRSRSEASILHADLDAFYASVEQRDRPELRGRPVIVGGGVVLAASYEAKACGVRTAMGEHQARRQCPDAVVVPPRFSAYVEASRAVFDVFSRTSPLVEGLSIDEAFLDVGGLWRLVGSPLAIGAALRAQVREEVGLAITVGVASTKFLAKVASAVAKPDGLLEVPAGGELAFLHPLPVERLWGVGQVTAAKLHGQGLRTVAQVAALDLDVLIGIVGVGTGRHLHALAQGHDPRRVEPGRRRRSIGSQSALGRRPRTPEQLDGVLVALVDRVARRLRGADRVGRTVVLRLRHGDYSRATRSCTLAEPTDRTDVLLAALRTLLRRELPRLSEVGVTLLGVAVTNLDDAAAVQLALPFDGVDRRQLDATVDAVRDRFGGASVGRAVGLRSRLGPEAPLLED
jgi:DNA polymerase-4